MNKSELVDSLVDILLKSKDILRATGSTKKQTNKKFSKMTKEILDYLNHADVEFIKNMQSLSGTELNLYIAEQIQHRSKTRKRFKIPHDVKKFIEETRLFQEQYPSYIGKKIIRKNTRLKQKDWIIKKDPPISVTRELLKEINPSEKPTLKNLSKIRMKLKRAKQKGLL